MGQRVRWDAPQSLRRVRCRPRFLAENASVTIPGRGLSALLALLIPLVAFAPLAGSAGPVLGLAKSFAVSAPTATSLRSTTLRRDIRLSPGPKISGWFGTAANEGPGKVVTGTNDAADTVAAQAQNGAVVAVGSLSDPPFTSDRTGQGKVVTGTIREADAVAAQVRNDALVAAHFLSGVPFTHNLEHDPRGLALTPGVYFVSPSAQLKGTPTHDARDNPNADPVSQIGERPADASNPTVSLTNGGAGDGVHSWDVGSSATLGTSTLSAGDLLADPGTTLAPGEQIPCGTVIALSAAVTMNTNVVSDDCTGSDSESRGPADFGSLGFSGGANIDGQGRDVPEPSSCLLLLAAGLVGVGARLKGTVRASFESA
jgi:hypothetical protein